MLPRRGRDVKATWKQRDLGLTTAFVAALLLGGAVEPAISNPNKPGDMANLSDDSLRLVVEEGRRQMDAQVARFEHVQSRSQVVLTVALAALGFVAGILGRIQEAPGTREVIGWIVWSAALGLVISAVAVSASIIVVRADFQAVDTTQVTTFTEPLLAPLAC